MKGRRIKCAGAVCFAGQRRLIHKRQCNSGDGHHTRRRAWRKPNAIGHLVRPIQRQHGCGGVSHIFREFRVGCGDPDTSHFLSILKDRDSARIDGGRIRVFRIGFAGRDANSRRAPIDFSGRWNR